MCIKYDCHVNHMQFLDDTVLGSNNVTLDTTFFNITNLQPLSQYTVSLSAYIGGYVLGPPTTLTINTTSTRKTLSFHSELNLLFLIHYS